MKFYKKKPSFSIFYTFSFLNFVYITTFFSDLEIIFFDLDHLFKVKSLNLEKKVFSFHISLIPWSILTKLHTITYYPVLYNLGTKYSPPPKGPAPIGGERYFF